MVFSGNRSGTLHYDFATRHHSDSSRDASRWGELAKRRRPSGPGAPAPARMLRSTLRIGPMNPVVGDPVPRYGIRCLRSYLRH